MSIRPIPYPFATTDPPAPPNPWPGDDYMTGWWEGYHQGIDVGRWRAETDMLTGWQRRRWVRQCMRSLDRKSRQWRKARQ